MRRAIKSSAAGNSAADASSDCRHDGNNDTDCAYRVQTTEPVSDHRLRSDHRDRNLARESTLRGRGAPVKPTRIPLAIATVGR